jgi:hypothetical protein
VEETLDALTAGWEKRPGASLAAIRERERALGISFPPDYVEFMLRSNGGCGDNGRMSIEIDPIEGMAPGDAALPYLPGLYRFGGDGAEEEFVFDARGDQVTIAMVRDSINEEDILWQGDTFTEFLANVPLYDRSRRQ